MNEVEAEELRAKTLQRDVLAELQKAVESVVRSADKVEAMLRRYRGSDRGQKQCGLCGDFGHNARRHAE